MVLPLFTVDGLHVGTDVLALCQLDKIDCRGLLFFLDIEG